MTCRHRQIRILASYISRTKGIKREKVVDLLVMMSSERLAATQRNMLLRIGRQTRFKNKVGL